MQNSQRHSCMKEELLYHDLGFIEIDSLSREDRSLIGGLPSSPSML